MATQNEIDEAHKVIARLDQIFGKGSGHKMYWMFQARKSFGVRIPVWAFSEVLNAIPENIDKDRQRRFYMSAMNERWKRFKIEQDKKHIGETYEKLRAL